MTKAITQYNQLSVKDKLNFNPDNRPGAKTIRADQARLILKRDVLKTKIKINMQAGCLPVYKTHEQRQHKVDDFLRQLDLYKRDIDQGRPCYLFNLEIDSSLPRLKKYGSWWVKKDEDSYATYPYSKSFHSRYGPTWVTENRRIIFKRIIKNNHVQQKTIYLDSWRGDYLAKAVVKAGLAPKRKKMPNLKIRLNKAYDAHLLYTKRGYKFYSRTLLNQHIDYVIVSPLGMIYHDTDKSKLVRGVHKKIKSKVLNFPGKLIDWKLCKSLGFCNAGIISFCDAFGFSTKEKYTPEAIERAIRKDQGKAAPFLTELKILADAINYNVAEFS